MKICGKDISTDGALVRIARLTADSYEFVEDPELAITSLKRSGERIDLFTFTQQLTDTRIRYQYPRESDNVAAIPVSGFDYWFAEQINSKSRNMLRKAQRKGITVQQVPFDDALVRGICAIYNETPIRQGRPFWHYGKNIEAVRRENETFRDRSVFFGAFCEGTMVGFAKLVSDEERTQAGLMQILSLIQHRDKAPANALVAEAVRSCADQKIRYLIYSKFSYGKKRRDGLAEFKRHNGFVRIERPRYYVPLTTWGRIAFEMGLHNNIADHIPESVAVILRRIRSGWHATRTTHNDEVA